MQERAIANAAFDVTELKQGGGSDADGIAREMPVVHIIAYTQHDQEHRAQRGAALKALERIIELTQTLQHID
jgi:hypothetical protein